MQVVSSFAEKQKQKRQTWQFMNFVEREFANRPFAFEVQVPVMDSSVTRHYGVLRTPRNRPEPEREV